MEEETVGESRIRYGNEHGLRNCEKLGNIELWRTVWKGQLSTRSIRVERAAYSSLGGRRAIVKRWHGAYRLTDSYFFIIKPLV